MRIEGLILDLDGTVYHGEQAMEGAPEFLRRLKEQGLPFLFATNRANRSPETIAEILRGYGLECSPDDVVTAATATALYLEPPGRVFVLGEEPLVDALTEAGFEVVGVDVTGEDPDYVVVGLDRGLSYPKLNMAVRSILQGAKFVGTNPDRLVNASDGGKDMGNGSVLAALEAATGVEPLVVGKPHAPLLEAALGKLGLPRENVLVVGDNLETDIEGGRRAGFPTAAIFTGISRRSDVERLGIRPDFEVASYEELAEIVFSGSSRPSSSRPT